MGEEVGANILAVESGGDRRRNGTGRPAGIVAAPFETAGVHGRPCPDLAGDRVRELQFAARAGLQRRQLREDGGPKNVAADDPEIGWRLARRRLLHDPAQPDRVACPCGVDDPVLGNLLGRDLLHGDDGRRPAALVRLEELGRAGTPPEDHVIGEEQGKGLPFEVWLRLLDGVTRPQWLVLLHEGEPRQLLRRQHPSGEGVVPASTGHGLDAGPAAEVLANGRPVGGEHDHDVLDAGRDRLLHRVLDDGPVDDRQHLLGDGLGRRKHARTEARREDDRPSYARHDRMVERAAVAIYSAGWGVLSSLPRQDGSSLRKRRSRVPPKPPPPQPRINERIRVPEVRLIDEEGQQIGVVNTAEAVAMARERDVDLVEVSGQATPPVARLMDFGRYKYEQSKKESEARKHQAKTRLREVRMKPKIDVHDIDFKTRTVEKLLRQGDKVKVTVMFRGREITHPQIGKNLLDRIFENLEDVATKEKDAALEGRHMSMILIPDKRGIAARDRAAQLEAEGQNGSAGPEETAEAPESESETGNPLPRLRPGTSQCQRSRPTRAPPRAFA